MTALRLKTFRGVIPVKSLRAMPDDAAVEAENLRLEAGGLQGLRSPRQRATVPAGTKDVYRLPLNKAYADLTQSHWMTFTDPHTNVVRTPNVNDSFERYYWASPSTGLRYSTRARIIAGQGSYALGVPAPTTAPKLTLTGGSATAVVVTRSYVVTYLSEMGEEGPPSPPVEATGPSNATWALNSIPAPPVSANQVPLNRIRVYRTITSLSGTTRFYRVATLNAPAAVYSDTALDEALVSEIESTTWLPPKDAMQGVIALPNGILAGWVDSTLYFSEPYHPHAWPDEYALAVNYPIVGLGAVDNTIVICTTGHPALASGSHPANMSLEQTEIALPCVSRGSIASSPYGVLYASETGLVMVGPSGIKTFTNELWGRDRWRREIDASDIRALYVDDAYVGVIKPSTGAANTAFRFVPSEAGQGVSTVTLPGNDVIPGLDPWSGKPILISGTTLYEWMEPTTTPLTYRWRSKEYVLDRPRNIGAAQIFFERPDGDNTVRFRVWAGRRLVYDQNVPAPDDAFRLPSGFKESVWQFEVQSTAQIHEVCLASTIADLRAV